MNKKNVIITIISVLILTCIFAFARTTTTDLGLVKPTWDEEIDILADLNANSDILEAFANDPLEFDTGERLEDRVGAMFSGNTETGLTITYQDADNTIDAVIGADDIVETMLKCVNLPADEDIFTYESTTGDFEWHTLAELSIQPLDAGLTSIAGLTTAASTLIYTTALDTYAVLGANATATNKWLRQVSSGAPSWEVIADGDVPNNITIDLATLATTFTCTDNESEALDCPIVFVDGAIGAQGAETDGDLHYNPSTGTLTSTAFAGNLLGNVTGTLTGNADTVTTNANLTGIVTSVGNATAIANKAIAIAKLADGTDGELITWDATGVVATVAVGTAGHVLTSGGIGVAPTFQAGGGGYTNLTSFVDQTAWRLFYSNNLGDVTELALGTDGQYLKSTGAASAPIFATPSGAGDMLKATYDTDADNDIDVAAGGTEKSLWTLYCIPYLSGTTAFGEIAIGTAGQVLKVAAGATGYEWGTLSYLANVIEDPAPELGGEMDAGAHTIGFTLQSTTGDGTTTIDWRLGNKFKFTFGAFNETFTFTAPTNPCTLMLTLIQDATGSRTVTWPATVKWPGGTAPTLTTTANARDKVALDWDGSQYDGQCAKDFK